LDFYKKKIKNKKKMNKYFNSVEGPFKFSSDEMEQLSDISLLFFLITILFFCIYANKEFFFSKKKIKKNE
jgi:hypothetical protein